MLVILETALCGVVVMDTVHDEKQTNNNSNYKKRLNKQRSAGVNYTPRGQRQPERRGVG